MKVVANVNKKIGGILWHCDGTCGFTNMHAACGDARTCVSHHDQGKMDSGVSLFTEGFYLVVQVGTEDGKTDLQQGIEPPTLDARAIADFAAVGPA